MRSRRLRGLCLALLLAGLPALARPLPGESPTPRPSFLTGIWEHVRELLPRFAAFEVAPPPAAEGAESPSSGDTPDLGLGMDPNG